MSPLGASPHVQVTRPQGEPPRQIRCQLCDGHDLDEVIDLGWHPPSDGFLSEEQLQEQERVYPLRVLFCQACRLAQLSEMVEPSLLFGERFIYRSGLNTPLKRHLQAIPAFLVGQGCLSADELAVDIGSNDGTLLQGCRPYGVRVRGVDPSSVARLAIQEGIPTHQRLCPCQGSPRRGQRGEIAPGRSRGLSHRVPLSPRHGGEAAIRRDLSGAPAVLFARIPLPAVRSVRDGCLPCAARADPRGLDPRVGLSARRVPHRGRCPCAA
ncbi:MAG: hypothetical protein HYZ91_01785 [Candidatus Omnitrophica bacterium]|nr:hypothetical protein [Candidatus Omnitrophota bacterium]